MHTYSRDRRVVGAKMLAFPVTVIPLEPFIHEFQLPKIVSRMTLQDIFSDKYRVALSENQRSLEMWKGGQRTNHRDERHAKETQLNSCDAANSGRLVTEDVEAIGEGEGERVEGVLVGMQHDTVARIAGKSSEELAGTV